jgi:UDP-glucose:(heptosyl)LPS alpha-1,3-glucosyltransferase
MHRERRPVSDARRARIGIVAHGVHDDGGMERALAQLVRRIHSEFDVVVFSTELADDLRPLVTWRRIPAPARPFPMRFMLFYVLAGMRIARERLDLVHACGAIIPQRLDLASIHFCHAAFRAAAGRLAPAEASAPRRLNTAVTRLLSLLAERWSYRPGHTRLLAPVSIGVARELGRHFPGVPAVIAPNGVDTERFRPDARVRAEVRSQYNVEPSTLVSLFVGGDWDHKGLSIAVEGLARAHAAGADGGELWVVGQGNPNRVRARARALGVEQQLRFFGFRQDTERFFQAADLFVLPTSYEAFSLVAHEAASSGLPLVVTAVHGVGELVGASEAGVLIDRSAESVGAALALLGADPELRARLGTAARIRASQHTWDRSAAVVRDAYRHLLHEVHAEAA